MLLNSAKYQSYGFYHFWVIKGKPTMRGGGGGGGGGESKVTLSYPPRLGLSN